MLRIKVLDKRHHPFTHQIKVYGISLEVILISSFMLIIVFVSAVYFTQPHKKKKQLPPHGITTEAKRSHGAI